MAASPGTVERRVVHLSAQAALTIVGTIVVLIIGRGMFVKAHRPLSWAAACAVAAILLDPIVDRLAVHVRRVPAVLLTFLVIGGVAVGTTYLVFDGLQAAVDRLETAAPEAAERIQGRDDRVGEVAVDFQLTDRVDDFVEALGDRVTGGDEVLRSTAGTAPTYLVCAIFTVFLMTYGPRIARSALEQDPDEDRRQRIGAIVGPAVARARSAILLTSGWGMVVGLATSGVATALDLPAPTAVGLTAGVLAILPHVGLVFGSVPLILLSLGFQGSRTTILLLVAVLVVQVVDSRFVRHWISRRSVQIGLLVPWIVALLGYEVYGIGGAAYGLAFAVTGLALFDQLEAGNARRQRSTVRAASDDAPAAMVLAEQAAAKPRATRTAAASKEPASKGGTTKKAAVKKAPARKKATAKRAAGKQATGATARKRPATGT